MRREYQQKVRSKGLGREFHSLRATGAEMAYVQELVELINSTRTEKSRPMTGHTQEWLDAHRRQRLELAERCAGKVEDWVPKGLVVAARWVSGGRIVIDYLHSSSSSSSLSLAEQSFKSSSWNHSAGLRTTVCRKSGSFSASIFKTSGIMTIFSSLSFAS